MSQESVTRKSNIELLRVILAAGVVFLHLNYSASSGLLYMQEVTGANRIFSNITEVLFTSAVDAFLLISGFFMAECSSIKIGKILKLECEVSFFSLVCYGIAIVFQREGFSFMTLAMNIVPHNYYITFYVCLLALAPFISKLCNNLEQGAFKQLFKIIIIISVIWPFFVSVLEVVLGGKMTGLSTISLDGDGAGYTLLNFLAVYMVGMACRKGVIDLKHPLIVLALSASILYSWRYIYTGALVQVAFTYDNPLVILMALSWFCLFRKMELQNIKLINLLGKASLVVYLLHHFVIHLFGLDWAVGASLPVYILYQLLIIVVSNIAAIIGMYIYDFVWRAILSIKTIREFMSYEIKG